MEASRRSLRGDSSAGEFPAHSNAIQSLVAITQQVGKLEQ